MNTDSTESRKRVALVCTNFTMQSAFGLLIIALNSVRLGFETIIYFTFEGLHMIRPGHLARLRYYPTGVDPSDRVPVGRPPQGRSSGSPASAGASGAISPSAKAAT